MKVGLIGAGNVGSACLSSLVALEVADEIVVIDRNEARSLGIVTDLQYGAVLARSVSLRAADYPELAGAAVVLVTAGINEKAGGATDRNDPAGRLKLLAQNVRIYREIIPRIVEAAPEAVIVVVTDPPDPLTDVARKLAGHDRVFGTGTFLDSLRFRFQLARRLGVSPQSVEALVLGEHGTSQVYLWSSARVGGIPVGEALGVGGEDAARLRAEVERDVRYANIAIIEGTGASQLGIGMVTARIAQAILRDESFVIPVSSYQKNYGVSLSLPTVIGRYGVSRVLEPALSEDERAALLRSADALREAAAHIEDSMS